MIKLGDLVDNINRLKKAEPNFLQKKLALVFFVSVFNISVTFSDQFSYAIPSYDDARGKFAEVLKTNDSGQFSFFTANPGN